MARLSRVGISFTLDSFQASYFANRLEPCSHRLCNKLKLIRVKFIIIYFWIISIISNFTLNRISGQLYWYRNESKLRRGSCSLNWTLNWVETSWNRLSWIVNWIWQHGYIWWISSELNPIMLVWIWLNF